MVTVLILTLNDYAVTFHFDILCIRDNRNIQVLGNLWTNLCSITIDSLTACDNQIVINVTKRTGNCCRSSPSISTTEYTVCYKDTIVSTHCHCLTKNFFCFWKSHGKNSNFCTCFFFNSQCCFQTGFIIRVHDGKHRTSIQCTVRVKYNAALSIRYLFNTYYYFHESTSYFNKLPEITIR